MTALPTAQVYTHLTSLTTSKHKTAQGLGANPQPQQKSGHRTVPEANAW